MSKSDNVQEQDEIVTETFAPLETLELTKEEVGEDPAVNTMEEPSIIEEPQTTEPVIIPGNEEVITEKTLHNTCQSGCKQNVPDVVMVGEDLFKLLSKASSKAEGWMKSTKAMNASNGVVVQVTTQQRNPDGSYAVAEAVTFVPNCGVASRGDEHYIKPNA